MCLLTDFTDPHTVEETGLSPQATDWKRSMAEDYNSLMKNNALTSTDLPPCKKALSYKWMSKTKIDESGNVVSYNARLVIKRLCTNMGRRH